MTNSSPSIAYVLPICVFGPGLPRLDDDLAFLSTGVDIRFFTFGVALVGVGRPREERMAGLEVMLEQRIEDLTSEDTTLNFWRTESGT